MLTNAHASNVPSTSENHIQPSISVSFVCAICFANGQLPQGRRGEAVKGRRVERDGDPGSSSTWGRIPRNVPLMAEGCNPLYARRAGAYP